MLRSSIPKLHLKLNPYLKNIKRGVRAMSTNKHGVLDVPAGVEEQSALLQELAKVAKISKSYIAPFGENGCIINVQLSQRDLPANNSRKYIKQVLIQNTQQPVPITLPAVSPDFKDAAVVSVSPSGKKTLVAKSGPEGKGAVLEVWGGSGVLMELVVPPSLHGSVYGDSWFGRAPAWKQDESCVVYVAESPVSERTPQWGGSEAKDSAAPKGWRGKAAWEEDWGELNTGKKSPLLFALNIASASVALVEGQPEGCSTGQPLFAPGGEGLVFVSWSHLPSNFPAAAKRLGIVFCFNRPCTLYFLPSLTGSTAVPLTQEGGSAFMPVFTPDQTQLLFLSTITAVESGVHNATNSLHSLPWPQGSAGHVEARVLVPVVQAAEGAEGFPGLYCVSLIDQPFLDEKTLLMTSTWRSCQSIISIDVTSGGVTRRTPVDPPSTWTLLGIERGLVVASSSTPASPPQLALAAATTDVGSWQWQEVRDVAAADDLQPAAAAALSNIEHQVIQITPTVGDVELKFEAIVIRPKGATGPLPAVLTPHGGPHTAYSASYYMPFVPMVAMGICVVAVNYRGSTGFGEGGVQSLPGHIGDHDVKDCIAALDVCIDLGLVDGSKVAVIGGSHGGFLTGHLLGQYPDRFRCAVLRNPVCNLSLMAGITDILDWCYVEAFGTKEGLKRLQAIPSPEDLSHLFQVSPAAHIHNVKAPMAFMLGSKDRRVPLQDGLQYISALRARGVPNRVIVFPEDTHALDKPQTEFEQWVNAAWWLKQYIPLE